VCTRRVVSSGLPCQRARSPGAPTQYVGLRDGEKVLRAENQPFLDGYCSDPFTLPGCSRRRATELYSPSWQVLLSREMQIHYSHGLHWRTGSAHALRCRSAAFSWCWPPPPWSVWRKSQKPPKVPEVPQVPPLRASKRFVPPSTHSQHSTIEPPHHGPSTPPQRKAAPQQLHRRPRHALLNVDSQTRGSSHKPFDRSEPHSSMYVVSACGSKWEPKDPGDHSNCVTPRTYARHTGPQVAQATLYGGCS
jgi:hypothetical protein